MAHRTKKQTQFPETLLVQRLFTRPSQPKEWWVVETQEEAVDSDMTAKPAGEDVAIYKLVKRVKLKKHVTVTELPPND